MTVGTLAPNEKDLYKIVNIVRQLARAATMRPRCRATPRKMPRAC